MKGKVYLVGAGPGDPELLTVKALRLLRTADAVLYDDLVAPEVLGLVTRKAQLYPVGKRCGRKKIRQSEINFLMVALAESGLQVVRLKSGDPLVFGRAGEEMESLRNAGVPFEVVPGITSALGAAAAAQIPLTHRHASSAVVFLTGHHASDTDPAEWNKLAASGSTLVLYMPGHEYVEISTKLKSAGLGGETPCALISRASTQRQQVHRTTVESLGYAPPMPAPTLLIVGEVVRFADEVALAEFVVPNYHSNVVSPLSPLAHVQSPAGGRDQEPIA